MTTTLHPAFTSLHTPDPTLTGLLKSVIGQPELWRGLIRYDVQERYWARIPVDAPVDVWLLTWTTSQGTTLHDHGDSEAAFSVVQGALHEIRPNSRGQLIPRRVVPGLIAHVPPHEIHDVRNELAQPAVSIHAYSPRLSRMTFYSWQAGTIRPVREVLSDQPEVD